MNSSLAAGAGQEAAIRQGMPIAQQDANTYATTHANNMAAENQYLLNRANNMTSRMHDTTSMAIAGINAKTQAAALAAQQD